MHFYSPPNTGWGLRGVFPGEGPLDHPADLGAPTVLVTGELQEARASAISEGVMEGG